MSDVKKSAVMAKIEKIVDKHSISLGDIHDICGNSMYYYCYEINEFTPSLTNLLEALLKLEKYIYIFTVEPDDV